METELQRLVDKASHRNTPQSSLSPSLSRTGFIEWNQTQRSPGPIGGASYQGLSLTSLGIFHPHCDGSGAVHHRIRVPVPRLRHYDQGTHLQPHP